MSAIEKQACTCTTEPDVECPIDGLCATYGHPCRCETHGGALAYIADSDDMRAHLEKAGVVGPSLHPKVRSESHHDRWNGWNTAVATGVDTEGRPIVVDTWYFASGSIHHSYGLAGRGPSLMSKDAFDLVAYPALMFAAYADIRHPEHTPKKED